jgi:hypothetical protein
MGAPLVLDAATAAAFFGKGEAHMATFARRMVAQQLEGESPFVVLRSVRGRRSRCYLGTAAVLVALRDEAGAA